jgi:hypothetical protein
MASYDFEPIPVAFSGGYRTQALRFPLLVINKQDASGAGFPTMRLLGGLQLKAWTFNLCNYNHRFHSR